MSKKSKYSFIVVKYPEADTAKVALKAVRQLAKEDVVKLKDAVAITKNAKGKVKLHQTKDDSAGKGFLKGGAIGIVFGLLFGGLPIVIAGAVSGTAVGMFDKGIKDKLMKAVGQDMSGDESALAVLVKKADWETLRTRMQSESINGEIIISELIPEHMTEVDALTENQEAVDAIPEEVDMSGGVKEITLEETKQIAEEAYLYTFPMLMGYRFAYGTFLQPASPAYRGPANAGPFGEAVTLDHTFKDVITPNADTPYSFGLLDLRSGPVILTVPEVTNRYYVMQFEDLLGQNDLFIGSRATGDVAGSYFLMGPTWEGEVPEGFAGSFRFETELVFLLGRTQLLSPDDQPVLAEVMRQYRLEPYEVFQGEDAPSLPSFDWPHWDDPASRDERFIGYMNALLPLCEPIHPSETELFARFASIGIGAGIPFDSDALSDEQRQAIVQGIAAALETLVQTLPTIGKMVNGWTMASAFGNRAFFDGNHTLRALAAQLGWGGNDQIEAFYPLAQVDANGKNLDGAHAYQLRWENDPPVNAFWSLTMYDKSYDGAAGYLVKNPINRYLINSTTEGLVRDADGGLTVTVQHTEPTDPAQKANWLPAPAEEFYISLRLYWPKPETIDGTWEPPLIVRVD